MAAGGANGAGTTPKVQLDDDNNEGMSPAEKKMHPFALRISEPNELEKEDLKEKVSGILKEGKILFTH